jgi:hypothetical protein
MWAYKRGQDKGQAQYKKKIKAWKGDRWTSEHN